MKTSDSGWKRVRRNEKIKLYRFTNSQNLVLRPKAK